MRRFLTVLGVASLATSLLLAGTPARAGELGWDDAAGDSFPPGATEALDIVKTSLATTPDSFIWKTQVSKLSDPLPGVGQHYTLVFFFLDVEYVMRVTRDALNGDAIVFQKADPTAPTVENLGCAKCKFSIDPATNTITLTASLGTLQAGSRKLVAGATIDQIEVSASVMGDTPVGTLYFGAPLGDSAPPPAPGTFTL